MSFTKLVVCLLFLGLSACRGSLDSNTEPLKDDPPAKENSVDVPSDYVETAVLNLIQTNQLLNEVKSNTVSIKGTGSKSTYKIIYTFNSGAFQSFAVSEVYKSTNCKSGQTKMTLKSKDSKRDVNLVNSYDLNLNTDYTLEVNFPNSCLETTTTFNLISWIGNPEVEPRRAVVCESNQLGQTYFFESVNVMSVFTSVTGKEKFANLETYCGETFHASDVSCLRTGLSINLGVPNTGVTCTAVEGAEKRSFEITLSLEEKTARMTCATAKQSTFAGIFDSCEIKMLDYTQFKNF